MDNIQFNNGRLTDQPVLGRGNWKIRHGGSKRSGRAPEYSVWHKMLRRCSNPKEKGYENYGGRGIAVCIAWYDFSCFMADMGPRPTPLHTIERVNNDLGYEPLNCVWATRADQARNRRPRKLKSACAKGHPFTDDNVYLRANGKRCCRECRRLAMRAFYDRQKMEIGHG